MDRNYYFFYIYFFFFLLLPNAYQTAAAAAAGLYVFLCVFWWEMVCHSNFSEGLCVKPTVLPSQFDIVLF